MVKCLAPNADVREASPSSAASAAFELYPLQVHDFTGTLCAPVASEEDYKTSDAPDAFSTEGQAAAVGTPSPSKYSIAANKTSEETLTQLDIKNFAQRGASVLTAMVQIGLFDCATGTVLRNTEWVVGMVIYCGQETKVQMNSRCDAVGCVMSVGPDLCH